MDEWLAASGRAAANRNAGSWPVQNPVPDYAILAWRQGLHVDGADPRGRYEHRGGARGIAGTPCAWVIYVLAGTRAEANGQRHCALLHTPRPELPYRSGVSQPAHQDILKLDGRGAIPSHRDVIATKGLVRRFAYPFG